MMQKLAIYDMDKTITRGATFGPFIAFVLRHHRPWRCVLLPFMLLATLGYGLRLVDRARLKEINLRLLLGRRIDAGEAGRIGTAFAGSTLSTNVLARALDRIEEDRRAGRRIVLATASYRFYVAEIARLIGVTDVIATLNQPLGPDHFSPRIDGQNCYGAAKLAMVKGWMDEQGIVRADAHVRFYSDHVSDAPCLDWADEAYATNPHAPLRTLANVKGWAIFDW